MKILLIFLFLTIQELFLSIKFIFPFKKSIESGLLSELIALPENKKHDNNNIINAIGGDTFNTTQSFKGMLINIFNSWIYISIANKT